MRFSICRRYAPADSIQSVRVLIVEDEPYMAEAIRDGLRLEAIAADVAGDGESALELLNWSFSSPPVSTSTAPHGSSKRVAAPWPTSMRWASAGRRERRVYIPRRTSGYIRGVHCGPTSCRVASIAWKSAHM